MADLRQLQQFIAVATELNFRRAAERLHMSQPPLSAAIRRLEENMGVRLFERNRVHVRLTSAGEVFLREAQRTLTQAHFAVEAAQRANQGLSGVLRLSFVPSAAFDLLPTLLRRFQEAYPGVRLILSGESTEQEVTRLRSQVIDLALIVPPLTDSTSLKLHLLRRESMILAVPASHALAARKTIRLQALADEPFVSFSHAAGSGFANAVLAACHEAGFSPRIVQEAPQFQTILTLVASGLGIALAPAAIQAIHLRDVTYLNVELEGSRQPLGYDLALASLKSHSTPIIDAFVELALAHFDATGVRKDCATGTQARPTGAAGGRPAIGANSDQLAQVRGHTPRQRG